MQANNLSRRRWEANRARQAEAAMERREIERERNAEARRLFQEEQERAKVEAALEAKRVAEFYRAQRQAENEAKRKAEREKEEQERQQRMAEQSLINLKRENIHQKLKTIDEAFSKMEANYNLWKDAITRLKPWTNLRSKGWFKSYEAEFNRFKQIKEEAHEAYDVLKSLNVNTVNNVKRYQKNIYTFLHAHKVLPKVAVNLPTRHSNLGERISGWLANEKKAKNAEEVKRKHKEEANRVLAELNKQRENMAKVRAKAAEYAAEMRSAAKMKIKTRANAKTRGKLMQWASRAKARVNEKARAARQTAAMAKANANAASRPNTVVANLEKAFRNSATKLSEALAKWQNARNKSRGYKPIMAFESKPTQAQVNKLNQAYKNARKESEKAQQLLIYEVERRERAARNERITAAGRRIPREWAQEERRMEANRQVAAKKQANTAAKAKANANAKAAKQFASKARANAMAKAKPRISAKIRENLKQIAYRTKAKIAKAKANTNAARQREAKAKVNALAEAEAREKRIQKAQEELRAKITKQRNVISGVSGTSGAQVVKSSIRTSTRRR